MKRLVIAPHDPEEFLGGTERVVQAMLRARVARGEEIAVLAGSQRRVEGGGTETRGEPGLSFIKVLRAPSETGEIFNRARVRAEFERIFDTIRPDVVEWHHGATLSFDLVRAANNRGARVLMFLHDLWVSCPRFFRIPPAGIACPEGADRGNCMQCVQRDLPWPDQNVRNWVDRYTEAARAELCAADARVAPSRTHANAIESFFSDLPLDINIIPHGLLDADLPDPPPRVAPREAGRLRIAHFGNLVPEKGIEDLARALSFISNPERLTLELYGEELSPGLVERVRAACPGVAVTHHGAYGSFRNIYDDVVNCDIAAFPSRAPESYGLVVDEALAAGLPVFVSDRGALHERVAGAGAVLSAESPAAWAREIELLITNPARFEALRGAVVPKKRTIADAVAEIDRLC